MPFEPREEMMFPENLEYVIEVVVVRYIRRSQQMGDPVLARVYQSIGR